MLCNSLIPQEIDGNEYLYRGIVDVNWDNELNRPTSAAFKDSNGVSVNRDAGREKDACVKQLTDAKNFKAVCRVTADNVRNQGALVLYKPVPDNDYHSEIHESAHKIELSSGKARKVRELSEIVFVSQQPQV